MPFIETRDGVSLFVMDRGAGRPLVFTHIWSLSADFWDYRANAIPGQRVLTCHRRSLGRSDQPGSGYDYDSFADDLADVMQEGGIAANATPFG